MYLKLSPSRNSNANRNLAKEYGFALAEKYFEEAECEHQKEEQEKKQNDETDI